MRQESTFCNVRQLPISYYFEAASGKVIENAKAAVASACQNLRLEHLL
jgi:hypothetical protein